ncbi:Bug family tripartite tricarboxylate transporter substrate binding protein [Pseudorhodoferax sp.]|uniref:Bug family tripartite tricarboxylate transporter substrate binding protein n=1 Tax=Pseudorhodoferax sp. TaxID=1993553 RepID=UPI002DD639EA|nr:tripartite tricarboxylate transporter substrate binding protein [Pseudorhodoferax sp.]
MLKITRRFAQCMLAFALAPWAAGAAAQDYPNRPVRLLVPYAAGSTTTNLAQMLAEKLGPAIGGSVYVENKPGAGGNVGMQFIAKSTPDGYSLLMAPIGIAINPSLYNNLGYDALTDLVPVGLYAAVPNLLVVNADVPARSLEEFIAYARRNPGKLNYASSGAGSSSHLASEMLKSFGALDIVHVPYKGGGPAMTDVLGGRIQMLFDQTPGVLPQLASGRIRVLGVSTAAPSAAVPGVPPVASVVPGFDMSVWFGIMAPAGTSPEIVRKLNAAMVQVVQEPAFRNALKTMGVDPFTSSPEEFGVYLRKEKDKWAKVVREARITLD